MVFVNLKVGDIFLTWHDLVIYMKMPPCERENEVYNAICMFGRNRGQFAHFEPDREIGLCNRVDKDI